MYRCRVRGTVGARLETKCQVAVRYVRCTWFSTTLSEQAFFFNRIILVCSSKYSVQRTLVSKQCSSWGFCGRLMVLWRFTPGVVLNVGYASWLSVLELLTQFCWRDERICIDVKNVVVVVARSQEGRTEATGLAQVSRLRFGRVLGSLAMVTRGVLGIARRVHGRKVKVNYHQYLFLKKSLLLQ